MKTEIFGRVILTIAFVAMLAAVARAAFADGGTTPREATRLRPAASSAASARQVSSREAIERSLRERIGPAFEVTVTSLDTAVAAEPGLSAQPEPGGRAGRPMRFVMMVGRTRRGVAIATVTVSGNHARAARRIARNEIVGADAIEIVHGDLPSIELKRLPAGREAIGLRARRDIAAGEPLTEAVLQFPPLVRSGEVVAVSVTVGAVEISSKGTASGSGHEGDIIRVTPKPNGRPVKARITGPGRVEIIQ